MFKNFFKKKKVVFKNEKEYRLEQYIAEIEKSEIEEEKQKRIDNMGYRLMVIAIVIAAIWWVFEIGYRMFVK